VKIVWTVLGAAVAAAAVIVWFAVRPAEPGEPMPHAPIVAPAVTTSPDADVRRQAPTSDPGGIVPPPPAYDDRDDDDDGDDDDPDGDDEDDDRGDDDDDDDPDER